MENDQIDKLEELLLKTSDLVLRSEARIDRTNEMIDKTFGTFATIAATYEKQICKLQENRDEILKQNIEFVKIIEQFRSDYSTLNKRYDDLIDKLINQKNTSENNITIK